MKDEEKQPVDYSFFDAAFRGDLSTNKKFIPISHERAMEIMNECINWHEEVYMPAEAKEEERLGRKLTWGEQMSLYLHLQFDKK